MRPLRGVRGRIVYTVFSGIGEVLPPKCKVGAWDRSIACWLLLALAEALVDGQSRGCVRYGRGSTNMSLTVTSRLMASDRELGQPSCLLLADFSGGAYMAWKG